MNINNQLELQTNRTKIPNSKELNIFLKNNKSFTNIKELKTFFEDYKKKLIQIDPRIEEIIRPTFRDLEEITKFDGSFFFKDKNKHRVFNHEKFDVILNGIKLLLRDSKYVDMGELED